MIDSTAKARPTDAANMPVANWTKHSKDGHKDEHKFGDQAKAQADEAHEPKRTVSLKSNLAGRDEALAAILVSSMFLRRCQSNRSEDEEKSRWAVAS